MAEKPKKRPDSLQGQVAGHFLPQPPISPSYFSMLQGPGTNKLTQITLKRKQPPVDPITGTATINYGNLTVAIENFMKLASGGPRVSTYKLFDLCAIALTQLNSYRTTAEPKTVVVISLDDYMEHFGIPMTKPSRDKARRRVKEDLDFLFNMSMSWQEGAGEHARDYKTRIISAREIQNSKIYVEFSLGMATYLTNAYIMPYPSALFKTDDRIPSAYHIGKKLALHFSMTNNQKKGTANLISVKSLLDAAPDIPSYKDVMEKDRHLSQRIITPFEKALNSLPAFLAEWRYVGPKGVPLSNDQKENFDYSVFIECYIQFELVSAPQLPG
ncbi:hypothetical protein C4J81_19105 (plasmid) [Deltaproteobacteria bacterium Smac51]|nr:hypothetical protein C4J81_19105 [Deltaproteobacteria bacterium Smac51]